MSTLGLQVVIKIKSKKVTMKITCCVMLFEIKCMRWVKRGVVVVVVDEWGFNPGHILSRNT